jgi:hypothetical protein
MQAIHTRYLPATNTRGSRIKATCERASKTFVYPCELSDGDQHSWAAQQLIAGFLAEDKKKYGSEPSKNPWGRPMATGGLPDGSYAHVFIPQNV